MGANGDICSRALFVDNLHLKDDAQIKDVFAPFGQLESIHTKDKHKMALILFDRTKDADEAYHKMHNKKVHHHHVRIDKATTADFKEFDVKRIATPPSPEDGELSPVSGLSSPPSPPPPQTPAAKPSAPLTPSHSRHHSRRHSHERSRHRRSQGRDDGSRRTRSRSPGAGDDRWGAHSPSDRRHHPARHSDRVDRRSKPPSSDHKRRHSDHSHHSPDDLRSKRSRHHNDSDHHAKSPRPKRSETVPMAMNCCYNEPHGIAANRPASPSFNTCSTPPPWGYSS